jgi:benzoyl-CoA-dihydrodiol lyase
MEPSTPVAAPTVRFETRPADYVHWRLEIDPPVARLVMDIQEERPLRPGYP